MYSAVKAAFVALYSLPSTRLYRIVIILNRKVERAGLKIKPRALLRFGIGDYIAGVVLAILGYKGFTVCGFWVTGFDCSLAGKIANLFLQTGGGCGIITRDKNGCRNFLTATGVLSAGAKIFKLPAETSNSACDSIPSISQVVYAAPAVPLTRHRVYDKIFRNCEIYTVRQDL